MSTYRYIGDTRMRIAAVDGTSPRTINGVFCQYVPDQYRVHVVYNGHPWRLWFGWNPLWGALDSPEGFDYAASRAADALGLPGEVRRKK